MPSDFPCVKHHNLCKGRGAPLASAVWHEEYLMQSVISVSHSVCNETSARARHHPHRLLTCGAHDGGGSTSDGIGNRVTRPAALDEMVDGKGGLRTHWRSLLGAFSALGEGGLAERAKRLQRAFEEEGVTSVLPGASASDHAWRCDPVPLPIPAAEFGALEAGLAQRATLLDAVLADLYGPQKLLADGLIPPALVYNNPYFLRACCGFNTTSRMQFYAADLVRGPDGAWRVLADRTSGAAGVGFARENRRLLTRVMPEAFRPLQVRQLRPFFDIWQDSLQRLAGPSAGERSGGLKASPTVALLTLLDERLMLQSTPTMWLGEHHARSVVQQDPTKWLIRSATDGSSHALSTSGMLPADRSALMHKIETRPWEWAATASIPPSMAPCLEGDGLTPRPIVMRLFLVHDGKEWRALQGGLARVLEDADQLAGRLPQGGLSKDVWVLNEERGDIVGPAPMPAPILQIRRATGDLPSRVADNLFWLGRYVERLEHSSRLIRAAIARIARGSGMNAREGVELHSLARCLVEAGCLSADFNSATASTMLLAEALLASVREGGVIHDRFNAVSRLTESVRDRLTGDMYATFTQALRAARADAAVVGRSLDGLSHAMVSIQRYSTSVAGVAAESMAEALVENVLEAKDQAVAASAVPEKLAGISSAIGDLSDRITRRYFALLPVAQTLGIAPETDDAIDDPAEELVGAAHMLHLSPRNFPGQKVLWSDLEAEPAPSRTNAASDHFGNHVAWMFLDRRHASFEVTVRAEVEVAFPPPPPADQTMAWEDVLAVFKESIPPLVASLEPPVVQGAAKLAAALSEGVPVDELLAALSGPFFDEKAMYAAAYDTIVLVFLSARNELGASLQKDLLGQCCLFRMARGADVVHRDPLRLLAFAAPGDLQMNMPIEFITHHLSVQLDILYVLPERPLPLMVPDHDVAICLISDSDPDALMRLVPLLGHWPRPVLNDPGRVAGGRIEDLTRDGIARLFSRLDDIAAPTTVVRTRAELSGFLKSEDPLSALMPDGCWPLLVRPVGSHAGRLLERLSGRDELLVYLDCLNAERFYLSNFVDYRDQDGLYRKRRVALIQGQAFLCHLAVSDHWMIHYLNAGMTESAAKRADEAAAMANFDSGFGQRHSEAFAILQERLGLDYFIVDCAEGPDGRLLLFEVEMAAIIHMLDCEKQFGYKQPQMRRVFRAPAAG
eukprot:gene9709-9775_t